MHLLFFTNLDTVCPLQRKTLQLTIYRSMFFSNVTTSFLTLAVQTQP